MKRRHCIRSNGYWKLLSMTDETPRVPVQHVDGILALLRQPAMLLSAELLTDETQCVSVVFPQEHNENMYNMEEVAVEYQLTFWNGAATGDTSLSLRLLQAAQSKYMSDKYKTRDSHFMHFRSRDEEIEWLWYDNDMASYSKYDFGESVQKELEATYQGVHEHMFAWQHLCRDSKLDTKESVFNCAQLPALKAAKMERYGMRTMTTHCLRFTFLCGTNGKREIANMEQIDVGRNGSPPFARNVIRRIEWKTGGWRHEMVKKYVWQRNRMLYDAVRDRPDWRQVVDAVIMRLLDGMQNKQIFELRLTDSFAVKDFFERIEVQGWFVGDSYVHA